MSSGIMCCAAEPVDPDLSKQRSTSSSRVKQVLYEQLDPKDEGILVLRTSVSTTQSHSMRSRRLNVGQHPYDNLKYQKKVTCGRSASGLRIGRILHYSSHTITQFVSVSIISVVGKAEKWPHRLGKVMRLRAVYEAITHSLTHTHTPPTHTYTHTPTHTHPHTHTHTYTHTHTHTCLIRNHAAPSKSKITVNPV